MKERVLISVLSTCVVVMGLNAYLTGQARAQLTVNSKGTPMFGRSEVTVVPSEGWVDIGKLRGLLVVDGSDGQELAVFAVAGQEIVEVADITGKYSTTQGTPDNVNVYFNVPTASFRIQNRRPIPRSYTWELVGHDVP